MYFIYFFLFIKVCLKYPLRCPHSEHTKVKIILHHGDMILEDNILLKLGKQNIASVLFALDLVTDIIVHICAGNLTGVAGLLDFFLNCSV